MLILEGRNVHDIFPRAIDILTNYGVENQPSRSGLESTLTIPGGVSTVYEKPDERVMFWPWRDANPYFHFFESLWMLAGREDTGFIHRFVKTMIQFSDDGKKYNGAYGFRWKKYWKRDQISLAIDELKKNPKSRRVVIGMWDPLNDLASNSKDIPCNVAISFQNTDDKLNMFVFCRSNDIIWGAYGANAVHMSILHEYIASSADLPLGRYTQISCNWHAYKTIFDKMRNALCTNQYYQNPYNNNRVSSTPLLSNCADSEQWMEDLQVFFDFVEPVQDLPLGGFKTSFFRRVVLPMFYSHAAYSQLKGEDRFETALFHLKDCAASDWKLACEEWIMRRFRNWQNKESKKEND